MASCIEMNKITAEPIDYKGISNWRQSYIEYINNSIMIN